MSSRGASHIRETANSLLDAFISAVEKGFGENRPSPADLKRLAEALKTSPDFEPIYEKAFADLQANVLSQANEAQRVEVFHRLMTQPLDPLLDSETLSRDALPNFFNFLRLVLGEEVDALQARCVEIHDELKAKHGESFTWDKFFADERAKAVLYRVLARIAETFRRFEPRREWFIGIMQYTPAAIGITSNVYVPNKHRESYLFGTDEFTRMFQHLFAPVKQISGADRALFERELGAAPESVFGALFKQLGA
jgi:transcriptional regulator with XRE-family HTH domain